MALFLFNRYISLMDHETFFLLFRACFTETQSSQLKMIKTKIKFRQVPVLPFLVVCDQIGRFQSLLVARFSIWSLWSFWSFWGRFGHFGRFGTIWAISIKFRLLAKLNIDNFEFSCFDNFSMYLEVKVGSS